MRKQALILALGGITVLALVIAACSKSSNPTSPYGGGGGGGSTGPTFNFGPFATGQSAQQQFTTVDSFGYYCSPHRNSGMVGTVNVAATGVDSALVTIAPGNSLTFTPATVAIKQNGFVRWVNAGTGTPMHTVTRP